MENLKKENNSAFEEGLREILTCDENTHTHKRAYPVSSPEKEMVFSKKPDNNKKNSMKFLYLRIIAAFLALGLIILFGIQIAYK